MIGYKAFDKELKCRGFQFEVGKTYKTGARKGELKLCTDTVFHFCRELRRIESESCYKLAESRVCEVIAVGEIVTDGDKYGTNKIKILREIPQDELNKYNNRNTGDCNTGYRNTGNRNTGNFNTGDWNTGNWNTGNWNTGYFNTGDWNTKTPMTRMFNQDTDKDRDNINFPDFLYFNLTVWVSHDTATQVEKEAHKTEIECCGGFLKKLDYKDAFKKAYENADKDEHYQLFALPNYNPDIFEEISGIDTREEYNEWLKTGNENKIEELQEEINKLKNIKDVADLLRLNNDAVITMCQLNNRFVSAKNKLKKAKGIIRKLLEDIEIAENEYKFTSQTAIKAEQFLKE